MQLNTQQKEDLRLLTKHGGFKVLEEIVKKEEYDLLSKFKTVSLGSQEIAIQLSNAQNKLLGMEYVINSAKNLSQGVVKAKDMK